MVLDCGGNDVVAGLGQSEDGEVVAFGAATGEDDFGRAAAQQIGNRFAGPFDGGTRLLSMMVDRGGVAEVLGEVRAHGVQNLGQHGRARVIVEIGASHGTESIVLMRGQGGRTLGEGLKKSERGAG